MKKAVHTSKPPATCSAAHQAWRYFEAKFPTRALEQLSYCAGGQYAGENGWEARFAMPDGPINTFLIYDPGALTTKFASSRDIKDFWA